jgi:hypothetical protein
MRARSIELCQKVTAGHTYIEATFECYFSVAVDIIKSKSSFRYVLMFFYPTRRRHIYMDITAIEWLIKNRLVKGQPEGETSRVWDDILHEYFRSSEGYSTGPEMSFGTAGLIFSRPISFWTHG